MGQRRAGRRSHAPLPAGVAVVPLPLCARRAAGAAADDAAAAGGVRGAVGAGDAAGESASGGLDSDLGDVSGSGGGGVHVHSEASKLGVGGAGGAREVNGEEVERVCLLQRVGGKDGRLSRVGGKDGRLSRVGGNVD